MPTYTYKARDMRGKAVSGTIALTSEKSVREHLRMNDLFVTDLVRADEKEQVKAPFFRRHVKLADMVVFSRQFASMVRAGVRTARGTRLRSTCITGSGRGVAAKRELTLRQRDESEPISSDARSTRHNKTTPATAKTAFAIQTPTKAGTLPCRAMPRPMTRIK